jgi:hypothetical protein
MCVFVCECCYVFSSYYNYTLPQYFPNYPFQPEILNTKFLTTKPTARFSRENALARTATVENDGLALERDREVCVIVTSS